MRQLIFSLSFGIAFTVVAFGARADAEDRMRVCDRKAQECRDKCGPYITDGECYKQCEDERGRCYGRARRER